METCIICTSKHVSAAEGFANETLAGYGHHILKIFGQMEHAEEESMKEIPLLSAEIHKWKKFIGDAVETNNPELLRQIPWDGLEILCLTVAGAWKFVQYDPNNSKVYDAQKWIDLGCSIRYQMGLDVPQSYVDALFAPLEQDVVVTEDIEPFLSDGDLADLDHRLNDI